jgi:hypothetical protein
MGVEGEDAVDMSFRQTHRFVAANTAAASCHDGYFPRLKLLVLF